MAGTSTPIFPQTVRNAAVAFANADGTTLKSVIAGGSNGTQINAITVSSTDSTARDLKLWINNGTTDFLLGTVSIVGSSGNTNALAAIDIMRSTMVPGLAFDALGNRVLFIASGWTLKASMGAAVTSSQTVAVVVPSAGDY